MQNSILVGIVLTLLNKKFVTASQLGQKYEISTRSVYRYVDTLCEAGVPIFSNKGKHGGIGILPSYKLSNTYFTSQEFARLKQAITTFDVQDNITTTVLDKVDALAESLNVSSYVLGSAQLVVDTPQSPQMQYKLATLTDAVIRRRICSIVYHDNVGQTSTRDILPCCLLLKGGLWYIYAFCLLRQDFRFFKITRIAELTISNLEFKPIEYDISKASQLHTPTIEPDIEFSFDFKAIIKTKVEEWLGIEAVTSTDKGYTASAKLPFDDLLLSKLVSFTSNISNVFPEQLAYKLKAIMIDALRNYSFKVISRNDAKN
ncbi:MAG: YafY family protein [Clostridia bacterium]